MAAPMAVPLPVDRPSMAWVSALRSVVGATANWAEPENTINPVRVPAGWCCTKSLAACWAAVIRFGSTSVAHIERDTSRARITEVWEVDTDWVIWGRAAAMASNPRLASSIPIGACRRQRVRLGTIDRSRATLE